MNGVTEDTTSLGYETFTEGKISVIDGDLQINIDGDEGDHLPYSCQSTPFSHFHLLLRKKTSRLEFLLVSCSSITLQQALYVPYGDESPQHTTAILLPYGYGNRVYVRDGFYLVEKYVSR